MASASEEILDNAPNVFEDSEILEEKDESRIPFLEDGFFEKCYQSLDERKKELESEKQDFELFWSEIKDRRTLTRSGYTPPDPLTFDEVLETYRETVYSQPEYESQEYDDVLESFEEEIGTERLEDPEGDLNLDEKRVIEEGKKAAMERRAEIIEPLKVEISSMEVLEANLRVLSRFEDLDFREMEEEQIRQSKSFLSFVEDYLEEVITERQKGLNEKDYSTDFAHSYLNFLYQSSDSGYPVLKASTAGLNYIDEIRSQMLEETCYW